MKFSALVLSTVLVSAYARPDINTNTRVHARDVQVAHYAYLRPRWNAQLGRREVPQEQSHKKFLTKTAEMLNLDNPAGIVDPVFGLLGNAAGSAGQGSITDTDCLQQATADQAFSNAKAAGDVDGMTSALIYRALERNTRKVGLASVPCTSITAVNPEIAALQQHQDPASDNAATINFEITITLSIQIASIGGDPTLALQSGTFAPGDVNDLTAAGNTCDDANDAEGCIFSQNLLVEDASVDDINSAVAAAGVGGAVDTATAVLATETAAATITAVDTAVAIFTNPAATALPLGVAVPTECLAFIPEGAAATPPPPPAPPGDQGMGGGHQGMGKGDQGKGNGGHQGVDGSDDQGKGRSDQGVGGGHQGMGGAGDQGMGASPPTPPSPPMPTATPPPPPPPPAKDTSPAPSPPTITALPNDAGNAAVECSAEIASALAAAGFLPASSAAATETATATATDLTTILVSPTPAPATGTSLDFGLCPNPTIIFAPNLDGRKESSFEPADKTAFTHGSALNIKVITDFICQQMSVKCQASEEAVAACGQGASAAQANGGKNEGAAVSFNAALGF